MSRSRCCRRASRATALALVIPTLLILPGDTRADTPNVGETVVATWNGGAITASDLAGWCSVHDREPGPDGIHEMAYVLSMAEAARRRGAEEAPRTKLLLESVPQQELLPRLRQHVLQSVTIDDAEIEALRLEHPEAFQRPRKLRMRSIFLYLGEGAAAEETRALMADLHRQLLEGADFAELATRHSQSQSRFRGGDLGFLDPESLPPEVREVVRDLPPGSLTEPIRHGPGISILRVEEVRFAQHPTPDEVRSKLRNNLSRLRGREAWTAMQEELLSSSEARIRPQAPDHVLVMKGYSLEARDLDALVALRFPNTTAAELPPGDLEEVLRSWAVAVAGTRRAVELGLDLDPRVAAALRWKPVDVLAQAELTLRVDRRLQDPTDDELRRRFMAEQGRYEQPETLDLAVIRFGDSDDELDAETVRRATSTALEIVSGALEFAEAARRDSKHPSASEGGRIERVTRRQTADWGPFAHRAISELEPGQATELLHLESGLWMFQLIARNPARPQTYQEALPAVRDEIRKERIAELERLVREEQLGSIRLKIGELGAPSGASGENARSPVEQDSDPDNRRQVTATRGRPTGTPRPPRGAAGCA